jgi:hypothetical protein
MVRQRDHDLGHCLSIPGNTAPTTRRLVPQPLSSGGRESASQECRPQCQSRGPCSRTPLAEREGFESSIRVDPVYRISRSRKGVVQGGSGGHFEFSGRRGWAIPGGLGGSVGTLLGHEGGARVPLVAVFGGNAGQGAAPESPRSSAQPGPRLGYGPWADLSPTRTSAPTAASTRAASASTTPARAGPRPAMVNLGLPLFTVMGTRKRRLAPGILVVQLGG